MILCECAAARRTSVAVVVDLGSVLKRGVGGAERVEFGGVLQGAPRRVLGVVHAVQVVPAATVQRIGRFSTALKSSRAVPQSVRQMTKCYTKNE